MPRRWFVVFLALAMPLGAYQTTRWDFDTQSAIILQVSSTGTLRISIEYNGLTEECVRQAFDAVPRSPDANWTIRRVSESQFTGVCTNCLQAKDEEQATLRLSPLLESLHSNGIGAAHIFVHLQRRLEDPIPSGWEEQGKSHTDFLFSSWTRNHHPSDLKLNLDSVPGPLRMFVPIAIVLIVPAVLAYAVRHRAINASDEQKVNWMVWMNWINLTAWLYWISSMNPREIGEMLERAAESNYAAAVVTAIAVWALPPLISIAECMFAMEPLLSSSRESFQLLLKRRIVSEAMMIVPLAICLMGSEVGANHMAFSSTLSIVGAYVVYRWLAWLTWTMGYRDIVAVESGDLFNRVHALARKAGVSIARLAILRTRVPEEANAFAMSGHQIVLTESLVKGLTPRELDAVVAHELGHHKAGHLTINWNRIIFWVYVLGAGPLLSWTISRWNLPEWILTVPITPLLFVMLRGMLSQQREFVADARAAEITGDPEGTIAALGRLAHLSRVPAGDQGIMGSIMSHPSMKGRVLALARRHAMPERRALEILSNPNAAYGDRADTPVEAPSLEAIAPAPAQPAFEAMGPPPLSIFTVRVKVGFLEQLRWVNLLSPFVGALIIGVPLGLLATHTQVASTRVLVLFAALPMLGLQLAFEYFLGRRFERKIRRGIAAMLPPGPGAIFAGMHPGSGLRYTEGYSEWDFGFVTLEDDWFCYRGEKTRFAIARQDLHAVRVVSGPRAWLRQHRVEIRYYGGVFTVTANSTFSSWADAEHFASTIRDWESKAGTQTQPRPEPPPVLPRQPGLKMSRMAIVFHSVKTVVKLWIASPLILVAGLRQPVIFAVVLFSTAVAVCLRNAPAVIWPIKRPPEAESTAVPFPAPGTPAT